MTLPLVDFVSVTLIADVAASTFTLPADYLTGCLTLLTVGCSLAATPLALTPIILDLHATFAATMGAENLAFTTTVVTAHHLLAQAEVALTIAFTFTESAVAILQT